MAAGIWKYWAVRGAIIGTIVSLTTIAVYYMIGPFGIRLAWGPNMAFVGPAALQGLILGGVDSLYHAGFRKNTAIGFLTGILAGLVAVLTWFSATSLWCVHEECGLSWLLYIAFFLTPNLLVTGTATGAVLAWMNLRQSVATS